MIFYIKEKNFIESHKSGSVPVRGAFLFCPRPALLCGSGFRGILSVAGVFFGPLRNFVQRRRACSERVILRRRLPAGAPRFACRRSGFLPRSVLRAVRFACGRAGMFAAIELAANHFASRGPVCLRGCFSALSRQKGEKRAKSQKRKGKRAILLQKSDKRRKIFLQGGGYNEGTNLKGEK